MVQRLCLVVLLLALTTPGTAQAASAWLEPVAVSPTGADVGESSFDVAMNAQGDTLAVWVRNSVVVSSFRPAGGTFGPVVPVPLGPGGTGAFRPRVAFDGPVGVVVYAQIGGPTSVIARAVRSTDGSFGETTLISTPGRSALGVELAANSAGDIVAAWEESAGGFSHAAATLRPSGGDFAPITTYPSAGRKADAAIAPNGDAAVVWSAGTAINIATRPAGGTFGAASPVASTAEDLAEPTLAVGVGGRTVVAYFRGDPTVTSEPKRRVWATVRASAADPFGPPQDLSFDNRATWYAQAAMDRDGAATVAFMQGLWPLAAVAPPGGSFGPTVRLSPQVHNVLYEPQVEASGDGSTHVVWVGSGADGNLARHAVRPPGGAFGEMRTLPGGPSASRVSVLDVDAQGNAVGAWLRADGEDQRLVVSGYDAAPPVVRPLGLLAAGVTGAALPFSVDAVDVWSPVSISWTFGDGATGTGTPTTHAYAAAGAYGVGVTATDALGNASSATGSVTIAPAPTTDPGTTTPPDTVAPQVSALRLTPARFRAAARGASIAATRIGTIVTYRLSEAARTRFTVQRATTGRRVSGSCRKTTAQNRRRTRCTRYVAVKGSFSHAGRTGSNRLTFRGRLSGTRLGVARYRLLAQATDPAGNKSPLRRIAFRIVAR